MRCSAYYACAVLLGIALQCHAGQLKVSIEEPSAAVSNIVVLSIPDTGHREISLVPERTYHIHCRSEFGFSGREEIWKNGDGATVTVLMQSGSSPSNESRVYSTAFGGDTNQWTLVVQVFSPDDHAGVYYCDGGGENRAYIRFESGGSAVVIAGTPNVDLIAGNSERRSLHVLTSPPPADAVSEVAWTFNGGEVPQGTLELGNDILLPVPVVEELSGTYSSSYSSASADFVVTVNVQPSVSISVTNREGLVSITCSDRQGDPHPAYQWFKNSGNSQVELQNSSSITIVPRVGPGSRNSSLTISPVLAGDEGEYECRAINSAGESSLAVTVNVPNAPVLTRITEAQLTQIENTTIVLESTLIRAYPPITIANIKWKWEGPTGVTIIDPSQPQFSRFSISPSGYNLAISDAQPGDGGTYSIEAENEIGTGSIDFAVEIIAPPILLPISSPETYTATASSVTLQVSFSRAYPSITSSDIAWYRDGSMLDVSGPRISSSLERDVASLSVSQLALSDGGTYRMVVTHSAGNRDVSFEVIVLNPPSPPSLLSATVINDCTATLSWSPPPDPVDGDTAEADSIVIEIQVGDQVVWREVKEVTDVAVTSAAILLPGDSPNASYRFRAFSLSERVGPGLVSDPSAPVIGYPEAVFPTFTLVESSSDSPQSIAVDWRVSARSSCVKIKAFEIVCTENSTGTSVRKLANKDDLSAIVEGVTPNSYYQCRVLADLSDSSGSTIAGHRLESEIVSTTTLPLAPSGTPSPIGVPLIAVIGGCVGGALLLIVLLVLVVLAVVCRRRQRNRSTDFSEKKTNGTVPNPLYLTQNASYKDMSGSPVSPVPKGIDPMFDLHSPEALSPDDFTGEDIQVVSMETLVKQGTIVLDEPMYEPIPK